MKQKLLLLGLFALLKIPVHAVGAYGEFGDWAREWGEHWLIGYENPDGWPAELQCTRLENSFGILATGSDYHSYETFDFSTIESPFIFIPDSLEDLGAWNPFYVKIEGMSNEPYNYERFHSILIGNNIKTIPNGVFTNANDKEGKGKQCESALLKPGCEEIVIKSGSQYASTLIPFKIAYATGVSVPAEILDTEKTVIFEYNPDEVVIDDRALIYNKAQNKLLFADTHHINYTVPENITVIGENAFSPSLVPLDNKRGLKTIVLHDGVTEIERNAFANCLQLYAVTFGKGLRTIGDKAFSNCNDLTSVILPNSVKTVSATAFEGCTAMQKAAYPNSLSANPFPASVIAVSYPAGVEIQTTEDGLVLSADGTALYFVPVDVADGFTIPATVKTIGAKAFVGCDNLTSITIPGTVETIESEAFKGCTHLTAVTIETGVKNIGASAFEGCTGLTGITVPSTVTTIGADAFKGCSNVSEVLIAGNVSSVGTGAFSGLKTGAFVLYPDAVKNVMDKPGIVSSNTTAVAYPANVTPVVKEGFVFGTVDGVETTLIYVPAGTEGILTVPSTVTTLYTGAFKGCNKLTGVVLPIGLTTIQANVFEGCSSLTDVILPHTAKNIDPAAFEGNSSLKSVLYPDNVTVTVPTTATAIKYPQGTEVAVDKTTGFVTTADGSTLVYVPVSATGTVTVPSTVTAIYTGAFKGCDKVTEVVIPEGVTSIQGGVFEGCSAMTEVVLPTTVTSVDKAAFNGCQNLKKVIYPDNVSVTVPSTAEAVKYPAGKQVTLDKETGIVTTTDGKTLVSVPATTEGVITVPSTVTEIYTGAFKGCDKVTEVVIPEGVTSVQGGVFEGCSALTEVVLPSTVTSVDQGAFNGCQNLNKVIYPENVTVTVPSTVNTVKYPAGKQVSVDKETGIVITTDGKNLVSVPSTTEGTVTVPSTVTEIYTGAFKGCDKVTEVVIPEGVSKIGQGAFTGCTGLTDVVIPSSVETVDQNAFNGCSNLNKVVYPDNLELTLPASTTKITYPENKEIMVDETTGCILTKDGTTLISVSTTTEGGFKVPTTITEIVGGAFTGCDKITGVEIPEGVTSIGNGAFEGCTSLTEVVIPSTVKNIGEDAFEGCDHIEKVVYPDNLEVNLPDNVITVTYPEGKTIKVDEETGCILTTDGKTLVSVPSTSEGSVKVPDGVTDIYKGAFKGCEKVTEVVIPEGVTSIGNGVFEGCDNLTEVVIPSSVSSVDKDAFKGCDNIEKVVYPDNLDINLPETTITVPYPEGKTIKVDEETGCIITTDGKTLVSVPSTSEGSVKVPDGVTDIYKGAFKGCEKVTEVIIPEGVTSIGTGVFEGCDNLSEVVIPSSVSSVDKDAFKGCDNIEKVIAPDNLELTLPETTTSITYPADKEITVDEETGCIISKDGTTLISVPTTTEGEFKVPEGVTEVVGGAFTGCDKITEVEIPEGVTSIGEGAFKGCTGLTDVVIPSSVEKMGKDAFEGLDNLNKVVFPDNLELTLPETTTSITYPEDKEITVDEETGCIISKDGTTLISVPTTTEGEFKVPDGVTEVVGGAFTGCDKITEVEIPEGVTEIGEGAFKGCTGLTDVVIPSSVEKMGKDAFEGLDNLNKVVFPDNLELTLPETTITVTYPEDKEIVIDEETGCVVSKDGNTLISVPSTTTGEAKLPDGITEIGGGAFSGCDKITEVVVPEGVDSIGTDVFEGCDNLTSVVLPSTLDNVPKDIFDGLDNLNKVVHPDNLEVPLPDNVTSVEYEKENPLDITDGLGTTNEGKDLVYVSPETKGEVDIPDGVTTIGKDAFAGCDSITNVTVPASVDSIGAGAFKGCESLTEVTLPDNLKSIGGSTFEGCKDLEEVELPDNLKTIGENAFAGSGLTNVTVPESVDSIGAGAFKGCENLTEVTLPDNLTSIGGSTFEGCKDLEEVELPDNLKSIGENAFAGSGLTNVTVPENVDSIGAGAFKGCESLTEVTLPDNLTTIGESTFEGCKELAEIDIPEGVTTIGENAFAGSGLTNVNVPENVDNIAAGAFDCESLSEVNLADGTEPVTIADNAFGDNYTDVHVGRPVNGTPFAGGPVENATVGNTVESIPDGFFAGCENLAEVTIGGTVTEIGDGAFQNCHALTEVVMPPSTKSIGESAFAGSGLVHVVIGPNVTSIGSKAFEGVNPQTVSVTALVPPVMSADAFSSYSATLRVHDLKVAEAYADATGWSAFSDVKELVKPADIEVSGADKLEGEKGTQITLTASLKAAGDEEISLPHIFWRSTNPQLATVDNNGTVTLKADLSSNGQPAQAPAKAGEETPALNIVAESLYADGPVAIYDPVTGKTSHIEDVVVDKLPESFDITEPVEIYDLNGVRLNRSLDELSTGVYIIRQNGTAVKIKR